MTASTLLQQATLPGGPTGASAVLIADGQIQWTGPGDDHPPLPPGTETIQLAGRLLLPAFVDAHAHVTETGLLLDGADLFGVRTARQMLDAVAATARARPGAPVLGHGWDDLLFTEPRLPTAGELHQAANGADVYLTRVDVHSALVSSGLADRLGLAALDGWSAGGRVERDAHHAARHGTRFGITAEHRRALQERALTAAAAAGIAELHECAAPHIGPEQDLADLLELVAAQPLPRVIAYWGELASSAGHARQIATRVLGPGAGALAGLAGDLTVDGSFGSHTAAVHADYADRPGHRGHLYLDAAAIGQHIQACTEAGLQAGFHAIGDRAVDAVLAGLRIAAAALGPDGAGRLARARHRIEHLEGIAPAGFATLRRFGVTASVQPLFDREWGGTGRMYEHRLGLPRTQALNPFAGLHAAGVPLAFGSDSPVTPFGPWAAIRAAARHHTAAHRLSPSAALAAHLPRGTGLHPGDVADLAAWDSESLDDALHDAIEREQAPGCALVTRAGQIIRRASTLDPLSRG